MKKVLLLLAVSASTAQATPGGTISGSKHDFAASRPGVARPEQATNACVYCHASHGGAPGLSNRPDDSVSATPYRSSTMRARSSPPSGASRACLSCHDGTIAVSALRTGRGLGKGDRIPASSRSNLGTDQNTSHPISMRVLQDGHLRSPPPGDSVQLDRRGQVQCTSCHDPHRENGDPLLGMFLVKPAARSGLCLSCHESVAYQGAGGSHASTNAGLPPDSILKFSSVSEAGCLACHASHGVQPSTSLVVRGPRGDDDSACLRCHGGGLGAKPIGMDVVKPYSHSAPGPHDPAEGPQARRSRLPETAPGQRRHAVCVDCHNPHVANATPATRPFAGGALAGVWGIDLNGQRVESVRYEYEICFKCHGDSANKPQAIAPLPPETVRRAVIDVNLRRVFSPTAPSSHPVAGPRRQPDVPSLKAEWASATSIACSDCHSSDGGGARGPHGSNVPHLLQLEYRTSSGTIEGPAAYALCYKCHDRERLLSDASSFPRHRRHVVELAVPCAACHNAHGVSDQAGDPTHNSHLIDFDVTVAKPSPTGQRSFQDLGVRSGSCNLTCHDQVHTGLPGERGRY